jgi:predicted GTPase
LIVVQLIRLFLQHCNTGECPEIVGHQLKCCTKDVVEYHFELDGRQGSIFDTPGFDDDGLDEGEVLNKIAGYSKST